MIIRIIFHGHLRTKLPPEVCGRFELEIPSKSNLADVIQKVGLSGAIVCAVNGVLERNLRCELQAGDEIGFFRPGAGG